MRFWRRVPSLVSLIVLTAGVASGCQDRVWNFGYQVVPPDGGTVDAPKIDAPTDHTGIDLAGFGGFGGSAVGGRGGSAGGGSGGSGGGGTGGSGAACGPPSPPRPTGTSHS